MNCQKFEVGDRVVWNEAKEAIYEVVKISGGHATINLLEYQVKKGKQRPNARRRVPFWQLKLIDLEATDQDTENSKVFLGEICDSLEPADYSMASAVSTAEPNLLADSSGSSQLKLTQMHNESCSSTIQTCQSTVTSETTILAEVNLSWYALVSLAQEHQLPEPELGLTTQNQLCGLKHCDASSKVSPDLSLLKTLKDLSIADYEQSLEDSEWLGIVGTIRSSYQQLRSALPTRETGCSLLPTPTTYPKGSGKCRPAGSNKLELSLRQFINPGDKLHPAVSGWMMGSTLR